MADDGSTRTAAWSAWEGALRGDLSASDAVVADATEAWQAAAWREAFAAAARVADPHNHAAPSPERLAEFAACDATVRSIACLACAEAIRAEAVSWSPSAVRDWLALLTRLCTQDCAPAARIGLRLARLWSRLLDGDRGLADEAASVESDAGREQLSASVIEACSLGALAAQAAGDPARALAQARRASRMGRTEAIPQQEYLANVVLSRLRRSHGRVHRATRILTALSQVSGPLWRGWIAWELVLAGDASSARRALADAAPTPAAAAATRLLDLIDHAAAGNRSGAETGLAALRGAIGGAVPFHDECDAAWIAIDPQLACEDRDGAVAAWCAGRADAIPGELTGLAVVPLASSVHPKTYVVAGPNRRPRRLLGIGAPLVTDARDLSGTSAQLRTEAASALLALAGSDGLAKTEFFRKLYGFAFKPSHQGVLDVLLHRVRSFVGEDASMEREEERIRLLPRRLLLLPEGRAERPLDDQLLRVLASTGGGSAREAAEALGVPVRTVQNTLRSLVDDGACVARKEGRRVHYVVEDTTFSEPTQHSA